MTGVQICSDSAVPQARTRILRSPRSRPLGRREAVIGSSVIMFSQGSNETNHALITNMLGEDGDLVLLLFT